MKRATGVIGADQSNGRPIADTVLLDYAKRSGEPAVAISVKGQTIDIHLHGAPRLRTDDLLQLDDGTLIEVVAATEPLIEARAADVAGLARVAWHLGDRHIAVQLLPNRIRVQREAAVETLLAALGAKVALIDAPFEPEGGAYTPQPVHDHAHHDHGHVHDANCGHDHSHHGHDHSRHGHKHD